jgi:hypothetical protein
LYACASTVIPTNITIASVAIAISVAAAFFASGGRKAGTPFDTASTPVIAVQPFANAVSSRNVVNGCVPAFGASGVSTGSIVPVRYRYSPAARSRAMLITKK